MRVLTVAVVVSLLGVSSGLRADTHRFLPETFYNTSAG
jgi:hypothetical protein